VAPSRTAAAGYGANGEIWFRRGGGEGGLWIEAVDPIGSNRRVLFSDTYAGGRDDVGVAHRWSPDGSRVAFVDSTRYIGEVPTGSSWDIYTMNADGTGRRQVTDDGGFDGSPSWSPDGTRIVYASDRGDPNRPACQIAVNCDRDIFVVNTDGTGLRQITDEPGADWQPDWAADGRILFVSERSDPSGDIFTMSEDGTAVTRLTDTPGLQEFQPRWSPDGARIAFVRSDGTSNDLFVMNADGSNQIRIAGDLPVSHSVEPDILDDFGWSPDGSMIAFVAGGDLASTLYVIGGDGQGLRALVEEPQYGVSRPAWRPILAGDRE
jgi:TolB protein